MTRAPAAAGRVRYELTLFVSGASERSARAVADATAFCDLRLGGLYRLTVVDLYDDPTGAFGASVLVAPALVRDRPLPVRKIAGDLSDADAVAAMLELPVAGHPQPAPAP
ncbi:MAG: circadian clock protein KaiB [Solirubrobacteraceae bacterium]|nr:circadian clock protein KaiB [Solirubrobacteraceae bacterium]